MERDDKTSGLTIEEVYMNSHEALKSLCFRYLGYNPQYLPYVEDCVQEVFYAMVKKWNQLKHHKNIYGWLAVACQKQCESMLRKELNREKIANQQTSFAEHRIGEDISNDIEQWIEEETRLEETKAFEKKLTPLENTVMREYYKRGKTIKQISLEQQLHVMKVRRILQKIKLKAKGANLMPVVLILTHWWVHCWHG